MHARRPVAHLLTALALLGVVVSTAAPVAAQSGLVLSTPYPDVVVEAGSSVTFPLDVRTPERRRVGLEVTSLPRGWHAVLRGGGFVVDGVFTDPDEPPSVDLEIEVPASARRGRHDVVVTATADGVPTRLPLRLRIAAEVAGGVSLDAEFPQLRGGTDTPFTFDLTLQNDTPRDLQFNLEAVGPEGWSVTARPSGESQAATAAVTAGSSTGVTVEADPPDDAQAGRYPIRVTASAGEHTVAADLEAEVTGSFAMTLTTPDERLNADVGAGATTDVALVVRNEGSAPLQDVSFTATPPGDWEVTFEPEALPQIPPGETATVVAKITPAADAVAGDYMVNLRAEAGDANSEIELRSTVKTSAAWGVVGFGLVALALAALAAVFRRYGRR